MAIVGNGDIASALKDKPDFLYFASGVSNSLETREEEYKKEKDLLFSQNVYDHIVYFSSLSIFYKVSRYTQHKLEMEDIIKTRFEHYTIMRLGNISWGKNPNTLINHLRNEYKSGRPLEIQDVYRYIIDKDEFLHWVDLIPNWNCEMNCPGRRLKVKDIVKEYVL